MTACQLYLSLTATLFPVYLSLFCRKSLIQWWGWAPPSHFQCSAQPLVPIRQLISADWWLHFQPATCNFSVLPVASLLPLLNCIALCFVLAACNLSAASLMFLRSKVLEHTSQSAFSEFPLIFHVLLSCKNSPIPSLNRWAMGCLLWI